MSGLWYRWKSQADWPWLALLVLLVIMWLLLLVDAFTRGPARQFADTAVMLEIYLPLAAALLLAGAPGLDREAGAAELHLSYRRPGALQLLQRLIVPILTWAAAVAATLLFTHQFYVPVNLAEALPMALFPALGLGSAALAGTSLARHQIGGVLASAIWWCMDLQIPGRLNTWFYLFNRFAPLPQLDPATMRRNTVILALAGLALALWLAERRERWVSGDAG